MRSTAQACVPAHSYYISLVDSDASWNCIAVQMAISGDPSRAYHPGTRTTFIGLLMIHDPILRSQHRSLHLTADINALVDASDVGGRDLEMVVWQWPLECHAGTCVSTTRNGVSTAS